MARRAIRSFRVALLLLAQSYEAAGRRTRRWTSTHGCAGTIQPPPERSRQRSVRGRLLPDGGEVGRGAAPESLDDADPTTAARSRLPARRARHRAAGQRAEAAQAWQTAALPGAGLGLGPARCYWRRKGQAFVALKQSEAAVIVYRKLATAKGPSLSWRTPRAAAQGPRRELDPPRSGIIGARCELRRAILFVDAGTGATRVNGAGRTARGRFSAATASPRRLLVDHAPVGVDPYDAANRRGLRGGSGHRYHACPAIAAPASPRKSPLTGLFFDSTFGGRLPATMKRTGFDADR